MKKKKYIVDGQVYEIPDDKAAAFLKDFPTAKIQYEVEGTKYEIPYDKADAFEVDMGLKKKPSSNVAPTPSGSGLSSGQVDGEIPIVSLEPVSSIDERMPDGTKHPFDLAADYVFLKNKTKIEGIGDSEMEVPDEGNFMIAVARAECGVMVSGSPASSAYFLNRL
jgi:hypothetical protein